jgi:hypothetical protein
MSDNPTILFHQKLPLGVWALRRSDGGLVPCLDDGPYESFMGFPSFQDAKRAAENQMATYEFTCEPVYLGRVSQR